MKKNIYNSIYSVSGKKRTLIEFFSDTPHTKSLIILSTTKFWCSVYNLICS